MTQRRRSRALTPLSRAVSLVRWSDSRNKGVSRAHSVEDLRSLAARTVPRPIFDYVEGGAGNESALRANLAAFDGLQMCPRVLRDVSAIDTSTTLLGVPAALPLILGPVGLARAMHPQGEIAAARAAAAYKIPTALSTMASTSPEDIARDSPHADRWFQLYLWKDRVASTELLDRAAAAGFRVLVLTVDVPVAGDRLRDRRHGLSFPPSVPVQSLPHFARRPRWVWNALTHEPVRFAAVDLSSEAFSTQTNRLLDPSATLHELEWLRARWPGPIVVKGVLAPADAVALRDVGVDGIVVSNHGGRQLENSWATAHALPYIRAAVGREMFIAVDGGIRSGTHIAAALALGANAAMIGRPYLYGLMAGGEAGVARAVEILAEGLGRSMALLGASHLDELTTDLIAP